MIPHRSPLRPTGTRMISDPSKSSNDGRSNRRPRTNRYPTVTLIDGSRVRVDANGLFYCREPIEPPPRHEIELARQWFEDRARWIKTPGISSYAIKHAVERYSPEPASVCNGAAIVAADLAGFRQKNADWLNTYVSVSKRFYRRLPECRMEGAA